MRFTDDVAKVVKPGGLFYCIWNYSSEKRAMLKNALETAGFDN